MIASTARADPILISKRCIRPDYRQLASELEPILIDTGIELDVSHER
jgi:hypothetical protein